MTTIEKQKTCELIGNDLDYWVSRAEGVIHRVDASNYSPSTRWNQAGPIIERERIEIMPVHEYLIADDFLAPERSWEWQWQAGITPMDDRPQHGHYFYGMLYAYGDTPLIAAMRVYIAYRLGSYVDIWEG